MLEQQASVEPSASPEEAEAIATLAYGYGFPLVLMDVSREVMTAVPSVEAQKGPINQFIHVAEFPDDTYRDVVSPNVDTLYSLAGSTSRPSRSCCGCRTSATAIT